MTSTIAPARVPLQFLQEAQRNGASLAAGFINAVRQRHELMNDPDALICMLCGVAPGIAEGTSPIERAKLLGFCRVVQRALEQNRGAPQ